MRHDTRPFGLFETQIINDIWMSNTKRKQGFFFFLTTDRYNVDTYKNHRGEIRGWFPEGRNWAKRID